MAWPRTTAVHEVLAIDIGGTKTAFAYVDTSSGTLERLRSIETPNQHEAAEPFFRRVKAMLTDMLKEVDAIGLSICELVSTESTLTSGHRVNWRGLPVQEDLCALAPCAIEADVRCAALAESKLGAGRNCGSFLYLNIGTGISSTLVIGGKPWPGARGHALVFANGRTIATDEAGESISFVLEDIAGGAGIARVHSALTGKQNISARDILEKTQAGDVIALRIANRGAAAIGNALAQAVNILDPEVIVLGGGLSESALYVAEIERTMREAIWDETTRNIECFIAQCGSDGPLLGAALFAEHHLSTKTQQR